MLKSPYSYFGAKSVVTPELWRRFGDPPNFVDPFFGSGAVLLGRPFPETRDKSIVETINDRDGFVVNMWRSVKADPLAVAHYADQPVFENNHHAQHAWLVSRRDRLVARLEGDPDWFDAKIAGWWLHGMACHIGAGYCSGRGPWRIVDGDGTEQLRIADDETNGIERKRPHLSQPNPHGIKRRRPQLGDAGRGVNQLGAVGSLDEWMIELAERFRYVRVCCGDWSRVVGPSVTTKLGLTAIILDPPYGESDDREANLYAEDSLKVADDVRTWAIANGDDPKLRIALCGYDLDMPNGWTLYRWTAQGGYGLQGDGRGRSNAKRECIFFSKSCINGSLFDGLENEPIAS